MFRRLSFVAVAGLAVTVGFLAAIGLGFRWARWSPSSRSRLMARKRKGRAVHGWIIVDKPAGVTSTAVVGKVRWAMNAQKAGHAGTLDPDATGVLAVADGGAASSRAVRTNPPPTE